MGYASAAAGYCCRLVTHLLHPVCLSADMTLHCADVEGSSPYHCPMCGVYTSSHALLEAHFKGRRHLKRALEQANADATQLGLQPGHAPDSAAIPRSATLLPPGLGSLFRLWHVCSVQALAFVLCADYDRAHCEAICPVCLKGLACFLNRQHA